MGIGYWTLLSPRTTSSSLKLNISPACVTSQMYFLLASLLVASVFAAPQSGYRARLEDEWANLNPFIANTRASPAKQAEMQAKWNEFLPYLDYLKGAPGAPGTCSSGGSVESSRSSRANWSSRTNWSSRSGGANQTRGTTVASRSCATRGTRSSSWTRRTRESD